MPWSGEEVALLQYTSGSTSTPRGVVISYENLACNVAALRAGARIGPLDRLVAWLPPYHDMGLIGAIITPVCTGMEAVLMTPSAFMRRPLAWLDAISQHRATVSVAPNFAYEMCVQRTTPEERGQLDLSTWRVALNGAERVHPDTLRRFAEAFACAGFSARAAIPCYGLAEATLGVTMGSPEEEAAPCVFDVAGLERGVALAPAAGATGRELVSSGCPLPGVSVRVVDPATCSVVTDGTVGELWVAGRGVAHGYWNQAEASAATFGARVGAARAGPARAGPARRGGDGEAYLRTGDLGFIHRGEVFVTGRLKDLIVVLGANHYPEDIERTVAAAHPRVRARGVIAFAADVGAREQLVVVVEVDRAAGLDGAGETAGEVSRAIREAVARAHGLPISDLVLVAPGTTPKTSSGKPQRRLCRSRYEAGELTRLTRSEAPTSAEGGARAEHVVEAAAVMASVLGVDAMGPDDDFFSLGGHSLMATQVASRLEVQWGMHVPVRAVFEATTPRRLAARHRELSPRSDVVPLARVERRGPLPLTHSQERMWVLHQLDPEGAAYNVSGALRIRGPLDVALLEVALQDCVKRHETLRMRFPEEEGRPLVEILPELLLALPVIDLSGEADPRAAASRLGSELAHRPFNLEEGPLVRAALYRLGRQEHAIVVSLHHIVSDAWSMGVLLSEVLARYQRAAAGGALPPAAFQYVDYAAWHRRWVEAERFEGELDYWRGRLEGAPLLELPTDRPRSAGLGSAGLGSAGELEPLELPSELLEGVRELALARGVTPFMVMLSAFQILLYRYTGQADFVIGVPIANRNHAASEDLVGTLVNTLALRVRLQPEQSFEELLRVTRDLCLEAYEHQNLPFERLVSELQLERRPGQSPLVQVMFDYQNPPMPGGRIGALEMEPLFISRRASHFDFSLLILDTDLGQVAGAEYRRELFERGTVRRMLAHYRAILEGALLDPGVAVSRIPLLTEDERRALVALGTNERAVPRPDQTVLQLIWEQASRAPDAPAVSDAAQTLTYRELIAAARLVAGGLARAGVEGGSRVALCLERSRWLPVALLAIHWLDATYVPLDPAFPFERSRAMLEDAAPAALLVDASSRARLGGLPGHVTLALEELLEPAETPSARPAEEPAARPSSPAYVIYTSGSTGEPKGVSVTQRNLSNFIQSMAQAPGLAADDRVLSVTTISFDIAALELFLPLCVGAHVTVLSRETTMDGAALARAIDRAGATLMQATPATWRMLLASGWQGRGELTVLCGGEALPAALADELRGKVRALWNMYGPTETTVWSTLQRVDGAGHLAIGRPIARTSVYVLDEHGVPVPPNVAGELYIGGAGVAEGYFRRPELTRERFLPTPFVGALGGRMYRTGDLGRMTASGVLHHLGRLDHQVKIRGHRIELGEVEATLKRAAGVEACVVVAWEVAPGDTRLVAYYVEGGSQRPSDELRRALAEVLPGYMIPSAFVALEALPLTPNGKVDRRALPSPELERRDHPVAPVAPRTTTERVVARLWAEVLRQPDPSVHDNFFDSGHSLLATVLFARIEKELHVSLPLASLFEAPTIEGIARRIDEHGGRQAPSPGRFEFLVPIRPEGTELPIFCVHGAGGTVLNLERLANHLGTDQPFYGLQARGVDGVSAPFVSIEEMAEAYLAEVRAVQPEGPYLLSGYCGGGIVAFEMARRLREGGADVAFLALIDVQRPGVEVEPSGRTARLLRRAGQGPSALLSHGQERLRERRASRVAHRTIERHLREGSPVPLELRDRWLASLFLDAVARYRVRPFAGEAVIVVAADVDEEPQCKVPYLGWGDYVDGELELIEAPGDHFSVMEEPHVRVLAARLRERLVVALGRAGAPPASVRRAASSLSEGAWEPRRTARAVPPASRSDDPRRESTRRRGR